MRVRDELGEREAQGSMFRHVDVEGRRGEGRAVRWVVVVGGLPRRGMCRGVRLGE